MRHDLPRLLRITLERSPFTFRSLRGVQQLHARFGIPLVSSLPLFRDCHAGGVAYTCSKMLHRVVSDASQWQKMPKCLSWVPHPSDLRYVGTAGIRTSDMPGCSGAARAGRTPTALPLLPPLLWQEANIHTMLSAVPQADSLVVQIKKTQRMLGG